MKERLPSLAVAGFIALALLIGGSSQNPWTNLALQLLGVGLLAWAATARAQSDRDWGSRAPGVIALAGLILVLIQLIPLPSGLWQLLPGREPIQRGLADLGVSGRAMPISLTPFASVLTIFAAIPALAVYFAVHRLGPSPRAIGAVILAVTVVAVILGAQQAVSAPGSWAYLYPITNEGTVGFFANRNHMATLLLASVPFAAALFGSMKLEAKSSSAGQLLLVTGFAAVVIIGIALNGAVAAWALGLPVLLASALTIPAAAKWRRLALPAALAATVAAVALIVANPFESESLQADVTRSASDRMEVWAQTVNAIEDSFPTGTGAGSFEQVFRLYEDPDSVTARYVNHAHNDYLELILELGAAGLLLILAFLWWWVRTAFHIWDSPLSSTFARASTVVTGLILAHSVVEFPLRTAAISTVFAAALALMASASRGVGVSGSRRGARHVSIG